MEKDNKNVIPTNQGLQRYSTGVNEKYEAPLFDTLAILDETRKDPETGVAIPSTAAIYDAKEWVDENRL